MFQQEKVADCLCEIVAGRVVYSRRMLLIYSLQKE